MFYLYYALNSTMIRALEAEAPQHDCNAQRFSKTF